MLGKHGPFVIDPKVTWQKMQELDRRFIEYWLSGKFDMKMIRSFEDGFQPVMIGGHFYIFHFLVSINATFWS